MYNTKSCHCHISHSDTFLVQLPSDAPKYIDDSDTKETIDNFGKNTAKDGNRDFIYDIAVVGLSWLKLRAACP